MEQSSYGGCSIPKDKDVKYLLPSKIIAMIVGSILLAISLFNLYKYLIK